MRASNPADDIPWTYSKSWPVTGFILSARLCAPSFQQILEVFSFPLPGSGGEFTSRDWSCQKGSSPLLTSLSRFELINFSRIIPSFFEKSLENAARRRASGENLKGSYLNLVKEGWKLGENETRFDLFSWEGEKMVLVIEKYEDK